MKRILTLFGAFVLLYSCTKPYEEHWESLVLDYENMKVSWNTTKVPVAIYTDAQWTASIADSPAWASLDLYSGSGVSTIHLLLEENDGFERSLRIDIESEGVLKSISVLQKPGVASPYIEFETASLQCSPEAADTLVKFNTNIPERYFEKAASLLDYYEGEGGWIENLKLEGHSFTFHITENSGEALRKARLSYAVEGNPGEVVIGSVEIVQEAMGGPMLITSAEQLKAWNEDWQNWTAEDEVALGADISLDATWEPHDFAGSFDGGGFCITSEGSGAIFKSVKGSVKNLKLAGNFAPESIEEGVAVSPFLYLEEGGKLEGIETIATLELSEAEADTLLLAGICAVAKGGEILNCKNSGRIVNSVAGNAAFTAGIVACVKAESSIRGCINEKGSAGVIADIANNASGIVATSGIVAALLAPAEIQDCESSTDIKKGSKAAKFYYAAGIAAYSKEAGLKIENCRHSGRIYSSVKTTYGFMGGILGYALKTASVQACTNSGEVFNNGENTQAGGLRIGGIVGAPAPTDESLVVSGCTNSGKIYNKSTAVSAIHCLGGISGAGNAQGVCIQDCLVDCEISTAATDATLARMGMLIGRVNIANNSAFSNGVRGTVGSETLSEENFASFLWGSPESGKTVNVDENKANYYWK